MYLYGVIFSMMIANIYMAIMYKHQVVVLNNETLQKKIQTTIAKETQIRNAVDRYCEVNGQPNELSDLVDFLPENYEFINGIKNDYDNTIIYNDENTTITLSSTLDDDTSIWYLNNYLAKNILGPANCDDNNVCSREIILKQACN